MLRKCAMVMLLISIANLAQASRLPAVLDKAAAAVKRAGLRASTTVGDKRKQFSQTLAALGIAAVMFTASAGVSEGEEEASKYIGNGKYIVRIHDGWSASWRARRGGEIVLYAPGWGGGEFPRYSVNNYAALSAYGAGVGLRPFPYSSAELKVFSFGKSLSDGNFSVALTHQLFGVLHPGEYDPFVGFDYAPFSINIGVSYNRFATYYYRGGRHLTASGEWLDGLGVAWQVDLDAFHYFGDRLSLGLSYFGTANADGHAHLLLFTTGIAFLE